MQTGPFHSRAGTAPRRAPRATSLLVAATLLGTTAGCSAQRPQIPPRPALPAVSFVPPCDPQASIGMTEQGVAQLRARDEAWRSYVEVLESMIRGER
ncbi:hypothetical protein K2Z84_17490 [Candidatus Binatia bacterium]|jgi:hypothetical protein|nr:hypothetical protein [Candidatus Binatia bacterium]